MNIVLVGLRGSGKSAVGKLLAERLHREFVDCDEFIEARTHLNIREIFELCGESYFRALEAEALAELARSNGKVISTGGGAVLRYKNVRNLQANSVVFFLQVDPDAAYRRISADPESRTRRPSLTDKDLMTEIREQASLRLSYYLRAADYVVPTTDRSCEQVVEEILRLLEKRFGSLEAMEP
jgi:shikimate kinase